MVFCDAIAICLCVVPKTAMCALANAAYTSMKNDLSFVRTPPPVAQWRCQAITDVPPSFSIVYVPGPIKDPEHELLVG